MTLVLADASSLMARKRWWIYNVLFGGIFAGIVFLHFFFPGGGVSLLQYVPHCIFHELTGLYCPGCGGTRAMGCLLRGDGVGVLYYNPWWVACVWILGTEYLQATLKAFSPLSRFTPQWWPRYYLFSLKLFMWLTIVYVIVRNIIGFPGEK